MKTDSVSAADLARSVIAVPPLARARNGAVSIAENRKIVEWMAAGGVSTFLYGGNANFYNLGLLEYPLTLEVLSDVAPKGAWVIPSIGPDFGKALDQVSMLKSYDFPTAMALPMASATKPAGVATGLRRLADAYGKPVIAYVRAEGYLAAKDIAALIADGVVCSLKYAVERKEPADDRYLAAIVDAAGTERIVSGIGERPAVVHLAKFGLAGFTSGSVTIAPHLSTAILSALRSGDVTRAEALRAKFLAFEDQRDAHSPIVVLHDAVRLAGIADTGPLQPFLTNLEAAQLAGVAAAAQALREENARFMRREAA
ncbi:MAG TPA: dihydrodipicolinate synthase family protein [Bauldia sp.]|nr:dihydrodipicolinate synthase family protein [Bauldia sp.]